LRVMPSAAQAEVPEEGEVAEERREAKELAAG
jgi:hypothetical protein